MFRTVFAAAVAAVALALPCSAGQRVWQPIIDYVISFPGDRHDAAPIINPFENFTHFASDFGWMGPGEERIDSKGGIIRVKKEGEWTGAWHSLAGLASQPDRKFDPTDLTGLGGDAAKRSGIRELLVNAEGHGTLRVELADVNRDVVWGETILLDSATTTTHRLPITSSLTERIKFMNWIAEPGCELRLSSIGFMAERPEISMEEWVFRISLGKLRRCHHPTSGFTRDRGHLPAGRFDSLASTGMHALGSALAAAEEILERRSVSEEIAVTVTSLERLQTASGFLPHFVQRSDDGKIAIVPNTEYSTVDTAICLQSLLLATRVMGMHEMNAKIAAMIARIDFDASTDLEGWISHGFLDDGKTPLSANWRDWGGETALVLALEAMIPGRLPRGKMSPSGEVYRGVGFIGEIQSLFYPDFDSDDADLVSSISWSRTRKNLLKRQIRYPKNYIPQSAAAHAGIFGLSAGESGMPGAGYTANGTEIMGIRWLHPHYMLMGLALSGGELYAKGLRDLDSKQFLYPMGLAENIEAELLLHNPMQGSLNASFETLSAYHGWKKRNNPKNLLDKASLTDPLMRKAADRFYPQP